MSKNRRLSEFNESRKLSRRAHELIPGGAHTYSKGDDQFPEASPGFLVRGAGSHVWDVDGNEFVDWGMGLRTVVLGYGYPKVLESVVAQLLRGPNFTRPSPVEVDLAEELSRLVPCAEMVKFSKNGSDVTSAAIRLARAFTGRDRVAFCSDHPFFSFYDWFIGTTPANSGVPDAIRRLSVPFRYNDEASLSKVFAENEGQIAAVIMEPATTAEPVGNFLHRVREIAHAHGAVLIFDEMITGFRWHLRGGQSYFGVTPDLATFGKAMGNGFSIAALAGRRDIMELGGLKHDKPRVFLLSCTNGAETHSLAAAVATVREIAETRATEHSWRMGKRLQDGINECAAALGLAEHVACVGYPCSPVIVCRDEMKEVSMPFRTLFLQEMIAGGILIPYVSISMAHGEMELERTLTVASDALEVYSRALVDGVSAHLVGPPVKPVFRRFN